MFQLTSRYLTSEEQLIDVLDDALERFRAGSEIDLSSCSSENVELDEDGRSLLKTLQELIFAADTWRGASHIPLAAITATSPNARPAPQFVGRYQIRRLVGAGAMGDVYEAYDPQLDRQIAVKVPRFERISINRAHFTMRFLREARAAAAVRHPHVCPIYDAGEVDGQPFVVMALVGGESLETRLSVGRIEDLNLIVGLTSQMADALQAIHEHGIIHRDLKPGNILIDESGQAIITDFGLAVSTLETERLTSDGQIVGTPVYMSPEQAAGENASLTPATDLYSLGVVMYEMFTGSVPFRGPLLQLLQQIQSEAPPKPISLRSDMGEFLNAILLKLIAKNPGDRYVSAKLLAQDLRSWLESNQRRKEPNQVFSQPLSSPAAGLSPEVNQANAQTQIVTTPQTIEPPTPPQVTESFQPSVPRTPSSIFRGLNRQRSMLVVGLILIGVVYWAFIWIGKPALLQTATSTLKVPADPHPAVAESQAGLSSEKLSGDFSIIISSDPENGPVTKNRLHVEERGAYPLRTGELVQFEAHLNQPAYIYLLWVNPDGTVTPIYPWDVEHESGFQARLVPGSDRATDHVICPSNRKEGLEAGPPVGLQTFVMLARRTPLPKDIDLGRLLQQLPPGPKLDTQLATVRPQLRGIVAGRTKSIEYALFDELNTRLSPHFEFFRMMTFPQVSE